ncbi:MAG TPA: beta-ketoacyl-[acyl-carrier-protein] synthase family protein, partial [Thermomicrobiales bacterium]|nr:beta-ketoacyl-[acyl-carrier-protein] synthase family protein [Thermomicrobiales bacterium]
MTQSSAGNRTVSLHRVAITGLGAVTSLASTAKPSWERILAGESGLKRVDLDPEQNPCLVRGDVDDATITNRFLDAKTLRNTSRFSRMAVEAAGEALIDAGLINEDGSTLADLVDGGTVIGTCVGGAHDDLLAAYATYQSGGPSRVPPHLHVKFPLNLASYTIQSRFGMQGPSNTVNTACATGSQAIGEAFQQVQMGRAPFMIGGSVESDSHPMFVAGFAVMKALATDSNDDPEKASRPFDASRAGFVLGEGAGMVVLEDWDRAVARGAHIYAELLGYASTNDAYHPIAPLPDGSGAAKAIVHALADAGVDAAEVGHVQAHAASTPAGDPAEANAIRLAFGERAAEIPVTSLKGAIGHCMGAAGSIEAVMAILSMKHQVIPPTRNYTTPDEAVGLDIVHGEPRAVDFAVSTKHSFGLSGQ